VPAVGEIGELVREWPGVRGRNACADKALEAVFESLGRACVHRLVTAPHPFGLPPRDRLAAQRWLMRGTLRRNWARLRRDLTIVLALVAAGLAIGLLSLSLYPGAGPASDAVAKSSAAMVAAADR
jgi:hypothetical protein